MRDTLGSTGASAPNLVVEVLRQNALNISLGLVIVSILSRSTVAQIAIDGRYWKYDGKRVLLLGGWNHGHNPFIDHDTDNDNVLYCMNNETHEDPAWGQYWMNFIERSARARGKSVLTTDMFDDVYEAEGSRVLTYQLNSYPDTTFELSWVNVGTGNWGPTATVSSGSTVDINRPNGSAHWVAMIVRQGAGA